MVLQINIMKLTYLVDVDSFWFANEIYQLSFKVFFLNFYLIVILKLKVPVSSKKKLWFSNISVGSWRGDNSRTYASEY